MDDQRTEQSDMSSAAWTPIRICMSRPSSMNRTVFWERQCFATTRQGYRQMLAWMRSFGELQRIGIESTGSYGAGLLRFVQQAGIEVLEVTTPDQARSPSTWQER